MRINIPTLQEFMKSHEAMAVPDETNCVRSQWYKGDREDFVSLVLQLGYPFYEWDGEVFATQSGVSLGVVPDSFGAALQIMQGDSTFLISGEKTGENAYATSTGTPGMGAITAAQPGSLPGHIGSFGSGDISAGFAGRTPGVSRLSGIGTKHPASTVAGSMFASSKDDDTRSGGRKRKTVRKRATAKKKSEDALGFTAGRGYDGSGNPAKDRGFSDVARYTAAQTFRMYPRQQKQDGRHNKFVDSVMKQVMSGKHNWTLDPSIIESFMHTAEQIRKRASDFEGVSEKSIFWCGALADVIYQHNAGFQREADLCRVNDITVETRGQTQGELVMSCTTPSDHRVSVTCHALPVEDGAAGPYTVHLDPRHYEDLLEKRWSELSVEGPFAERIPLYAVKKFILE